MDELSFMEAVALRVMNPDLDPQKLADAVCRRISRQLALSSTTSIMVSQDRESPDDNTCY